MSGWGAARATGWRWEGARSAHDDRGCAAYGRTRAWAVASSVWASRSSHHAMEGKAAVGVGGGATAAAAGCGAHALRARHPLFRLPRPSSSPACRAPSQRAPPQAVPLLPSRSPSHQRRSHPPSFLCQDSLPWSTKKKTEEKAAWGCATTRHQDVPSQPKRCHDDQRRDAVWPPPPPPAPTPPSPPPKKKAASKKRYTPRCYAAVPCRNTASATAPMAGPPISGAACRSRHAMIKTSDPK